MQAAVFFLEGSAKIFSTGSSGNCSLTIDTYSSEVTMYIFSNGINALYLSKVHCISDFPVCKISKNCFGYAVLLIGQNLLPIPPAIMAT